MRFQTQRSNKPARNDLLNHKTRWFGYLEHCYNLCIDVAMQNFMRKAFKSSSGTAGDEAVCRTQKHIIRSGEDFLPERGKAYGC
jgi:hypothetical protein